MSHLDPRNPLVLDTRTLVRRAGQMDTVESSVPAPTGFGLDVISVPEGAPLHMFLRLESVVEGVLVSGSCQGQATGECVRCLDALTLELELPVQELFAYPGSASAEASEIAQLEDDLIDLEPLLRDAVVLALPLQPLCRDDCPGLCATCGARLADDPTHEHVEIDPRWAGLEQLNVTHAASDEKKG